MPTVREWVKQNAKKYVRETLIQTGCKELNVGRAQLLKMVALELGSAGKVVRVTGTGSGAISLDQFRSRFDPLHKLRAACVVLKSNKDDIYPEAEFREKLAQLGTSQFRSKADGEEFVQYQGRIQGKTYWGHPATIAALKNEGVMS
jgi:hypothetical protein